MSRERVTIVVTREERDAFVGFTARLRPPRGFRRDKTYRERQTIANAVFQKIADARVASWGRRTRC